MIPHGRRLDVPLGFRVIGTYKLVSAALAVALGFGLVRLFHGDVAASLEALIRGLGMDPENRHVHRLLGFVMRVDRRRLEWIEAGTFAYAALHLVEGVGILRGRRWGGALIILATSSLIPLEVFEIARQPRPLRVVALMANAAIVAYLVKNRGRLHRGPESGPGAVRP